MRKIICADPTLLKMQCYEQPQVPLKSLIMEEVAPQKLWRELCYLSQRQ